MENIENINKLKDLSSEFTILFVEDSLALQKQVVIFLKKLFKEVFVASNGQEGLESFQKNKPDLVLTDLTMPIMSGHDMIRAIKKVDADVQVVILSAHSDSETLMKSLHIGVCDFIAKPVNATKMITTFLKVLSNMKRKEFELVETFSHSVKEMAKEEHSNDDEVLEFILENSMQIDIINHYKGVPIINSSKILKIEEDTIYLKATYLQILAMKHEQNAILDSSLISKDILCSLEEFDLDNYEVRLKKERLFYPDFKNRNELFLELPIDFKVNIILSDEIKIKVKALNLSVKELRFEVESDIQFDKHQKIKLDVTLPIFNTLKNNNNQKEVLSINASVYKFEKLNNKKDIIVLLNLNEQQEEIISKYINDREIYLIDEFKEKYNY